MCKKKQGRGGFPNDEMRAHAAEMRGHVKTLEKTLQPIEDADDFFHMYDALVTSRSAAVVNRNQLLAAWKRGGELYTLQIKQTDELFKDHELRIKVAKLVLEHLVNEARKCFEDDAYSTAIWRTRPRPKQPVRGPGRPGFMTQSIMDRLRVAAAFLLDRRLALHTGKPGWKIKGIILAKLMNRWREGKNSSCASCV